MQALQALLTESPPWERHAVLAVWLSSAVFALAVAFDLPAWQMAVGVAAGAIMVALDYRNWGAA